MNGMEVRKKRPRRFKKEAQGVQVSPLNPLHVSAAPWLVPFFQLSSPAPLPDSCAKPPGPLGLAIA